MLVIRDGKKEIWIIEVKPIRSITSKSQRHKLEVKFQFARDTCEKNGWKFYVFTDLFKSHSWRFENLMDLRSQIRWSNKKIANEIMERFSSENQIKISDIISSFPNYSKSETRASLYSLIYNDKLYIDHTIPLSDNSNVHVSPNEYETLFDWLETYSLENKEILLDDSIGAEEIFDKSEWAINLELESEKIISYYKNGMSYSVIVEELKKEGINVSKTKVARIIKQSKFGFLSKINVKGKKGVSGQKRIRLFEEDDYGKATFKDKFFEQIINAYLNNTRIKKMQAWKMYYTSIRIEYASDGIVEPNAKVSELLEAIPTMASKHIFMRNLNDFIEKYEDFVAIKRVGFKAANKLHRDIKGITPHKSYIGQTVEPDHTPSDILPVISPYYFHKYLKNGSFDLEKMPRAKLTTALDRKSRAIVSYALRYKDPSAETNHLIMRRMFLGNVSPLYSEKMAKKASTVEKIKTGYRSLFDRQIIGEETYYGTIQYLENELFKLAEWFDNLKVIPHTLAMDNGSDFTSTQLAYLGMENRIDFHYRPVGGSNYGGMVERAIKTINYDAFHNLPGTTKGSIEQKGDIDPDKYKILKFEELEAILLIKLLEYHITPHSGLDGLTPKTVWDNGVKDGHSIYPEFSSIEEKNKFLRKIAYESIPIALNSHNNIPQYHENKGITLSKIWYNYNANNLHPEDLSWSYIYKKRDKIKVRQSKDDIRFVYWFNPNLGKVVRVWAIMIKINGIQYSGKKLEDLPPISLNQLKDEKALELLININELEKQEKTLAFIENVQVSTNLDIFENTKSKKKKAKIIAQEVEKQKLKNIEASEREENFIDKEIIKPLVNTKNNMKKKSKSKLDWGSLSNYPDIDKKRK